MSDGSWRRPRGTVREMRPTVVTTSAGEVDRDDRGDDDDDGDDDDGDDQDDGDGGDDNDDDRRA